MDMVKTLEDKNKNSIPDEIEEGIKALIEDMKNGDFFGNYAKVTFPPYDTPSNAWSGWNKVLISMLNDWKENPNCDWRGFNQWKEIGRSVKKGETAKYILVPMIGKYKYYKDQEGKKKRLEKDEEAPEDTEIKEAQYLRGFKGVPVFAYEQTKGKKIVGLKKLKLPKLNYMEVAKFLKIDVFAVAQKSNFYGYYSPTRKQIALASPDESVFYHELAHAVDDYLDKQKGGVGLKSGQQADQEMVAEMSAGVLARMNGQDIKQVTANTKKYVEAYGGKDTYKELMLLMTRINRVIEFITNIIQMN